MNSPLGKYSQVVAAAAALGILLSFAIAALAGNREAVSTLSPFAFASFGAIFTAAAVTNGWKQVVAQQQAQTAAIHTRLDQLGAPPAALVDAVKP